MPLLTLQELEQATPLFRGTVGNALARGAMHLLSVDRANALYDRNTRFHGPDFAHSVLRELGVEYDVYATSSSVLAQWNVLHSDTPFITLSNHPYGGLDGLILADLFGHLCPDYKLMVNKLLSRIEPLSDLFIAVTPIGAEPSEPTAESVAGVRQVIAHLRQGGALGLFPAGAVSNLRLCPYGVHDREWPLPIVRLIARARVPIVPVCFLDGNSWFYYALGLIDWRVRLLRLPAEFFNKCGRPVRLVIGATISVEEQHEYLSTHTIGEFGLWLRSKGQGMMTMNK